MGFLKRLFSIGTKKNKKKNRAVALDIPPLPEQVLSTPTDDEEHEVQVGKFLRSTSARFVETSELVYNTLPPIPHPINKVIQTPASSTLSLESTSLSQRGTYNVTVHRRRRHASTEFPLANRDLNQDNNTGGLQPVEDSRVLKLRSDPSVASLLELYDEHGRVANDAFSNDETLPVQEGRAQVRRSGSTFRQLLGAPSVKDGNDNSEGDISWAERFLGESDGTSVVSSSGLKTPEISPFSEGVTVPEVSVASDVDLSFATFDNPAISSMEVEVNNSYDSSRDLARPSNSPYICADPTTPQRASQIFGFLTKGKQSKSPIDRALPEPPSCFSSPSDEGNDDHRRSFSKRDSFANISFNPNHFSAPLIPHNDDTQRMPRPRSSVIEAPSRTENRLSQELRSAFSEDTHDFHENMGPFTPQPPLKESPSVDNAKQNDIRILMTGPTKVILTAPTPGTNHVGPSRLLRGPRGPTRKSSSGSVKKRRSVLGEVSSNSSCMAGDPFVIVSPRQKVHRERSNSNSSVRSFSRQDYEKYDNYISHPKKARPTSPAPPKGNYLKENQLCLSVKNELPSTPLRSNTTASSRSFFRNVIQQRALRTPALPDPNLSSELSPVGRQVMNDVRHQRMRTRETERARLGNRF